MSAVAAAGDGEAQSEAQNGPRSRKGAQTRARLLGAAKEIFEESGFLEARISDIAERASLSHGAFYHYFESKEQVFREIAELLDDRLSEPMNVVLASASTAGPKERLLISIRDHLARYQEEARIMGVIEQVARYDEHVAAVRATRGRLHREEMEASIRRLQRRGLADRTIDPAIAAAALGAMVERFAEMWLAQGQLSCDVDSAAETLATIFVNALGMRDATPD